MDYKVRYHPRKKQLVVSVFLDNGTRIATYIEESPSLDLVERMEYATKEDIKNYLSTSCSYYLIG